MLPRVLPLEDEEISAEADKILAKHMAIHTGARPRPRSRPPTGVEVGFRTATGEAKTVTADLLLVAVGRGPVTDGLGLESTQGEARAAASSGRTTAWRPTSPGSSPSATW